MIPLFFFLFCVYGAIGCGQKKLHACEAVPAAPVRVPSQRALAPSVASVTSVANDKDDNDPGGCAQISWQILQNKNVLQLVLHLYVDTAVEGSEL